MAKGGDRIDAILGKGTQFEGQLTFEGTVRIDGTFKGEIHTDGTLIIGQDALVEAEISCGTLMASGTITGNIHASQRLEATAPAKIRGAIKTPVLVINEGVIFDGTSSMEIEEKEGLPKHTKIPFIGKHKKKGPPVEELFAEGTEE